VLAKDKNGRVLAVGNSVRYDGADWVVDKVLVDSVRIINSRERVTVKSNRVTKAPF
jgi:hypothetical protein